VLKKNLRTEKVNSGKVILSHIIYVQMSQSSISDNYLTLCHPSLFMVWWCRCRVFAGTWS